MSKREKLPSDGPYVKLHKGTIESQAWRALSHGARCLFTELWSKTDNADHRSYLSYREAARKLGSARHKVREWFAELEHYGFIVMLQMHSLGTDGRGKAALWRVTDKGTIRGGYEAPTKDFLKWDGVLFDPKPYRAKHGTREWSNIKKQNPGTHVGDRVVPTYDPPLVPTGDPPRSASGTRVGAIEQEGSGTDVGDITSLTSTPPLEPVYQLPLDTLRGSEIFGPKDVRVFTTERSRNAERGSVS
jgi:hypothetical protein